MKCHTCLRGAPADSKRRTYYCTVVGGQRDPGESRGDYLERSRVEARMNCEAYVCRAYYTEVSR